MKTIASRMLTAAPGKVWAELEREGALVVTKDGVPRSIMIPTSDATLFEDIGEIVFARACRAVRAIRTQSVHSEAEVATRADIEREIKAARRNRKHRLSENLFRGYLNS